MSRAHRVMSSLLVCASLAASNQAIAEDLAIDDQFNLAVGAYFITRTGGQIRVDETSGVIGLGTSIDWEDDLGGDSSMTVPRLDGYYRFAPKHRVDFSWYNINREGRITAQRDIVFGDINISAGDFLATDFDTDVLKLAYTYSFYRAPEIETAVSAGIHVTRLDMSIESTNLGVTEKESVTAPLPVFGFRLDYALNPQWWVRTKYELFFLDNIDTFTSTLSDFTLAVEHRTFRHTSLGFGINRSSTEVRVSDGDTRGAYSSILNGLMLYVVIR